MYEKPMLREVAFEAASCACNTHSPPPPPPPPEDDRLLSDFGFEGECYGDTEVGVSDGEPKVGALGYDVVCLLEPKADVHPPNPDSVLGRVENIPEEVLLNPDGLPGLGGDIKIICMGSC